MAQIEQGDVRRTLLEFSRDWRRPATWKLDEHEWEGAVFSDDGQSICSISVFNVEGSVNAGMMRLLDCHPHFSQLWKLQLLGLHWAPGLLANLPRSLEFLWITTDPADRWPVSLGEVSQCCPGLRHLALRGFSGNIAELALLPESIRFVDVAHCAFSGRFPTDLRHLRVLETLRLTGNALVQGQISLAAMPTTLKNLVRLGTALTVAIDPVEARRRELEYDVLTAATAAPRDRPADLLVQEICDQRTRELMRESRRIQASWSTARQTGDPAPVSDRMPRTFPAVVPAETASSNTAFAVPAARAEPLTMEFFDMLGMHARALDRQPSGIRDLGAAEAVLDLLRRTPAPAQPAPRVAQPRAEGALNARVVGAAAAAVEAAPRLRRPPLSLNPRVEM